MWICYVRCLRFRLPPSKHSPPSPVGHGRGLASRPGWAGPGEGGGSPWLHLASSGVRRYCSAPPASALPPPGFTHARRDDAGFLPPLRQPAAARVARDSLCLPPVMPYRLRRGYSRPTLLPCPSASTGPAAPRRITPRFLSFSGHCHEQQPPPDSRPVSVAAGGNPPNKRLLPISAAHPTIDVMQSSRAQRVYSPLRFAYGYITRAIVRRASAGGSSRQDYAARSPFPAQVR